MHCVREVPVRGPAKVAAAAAGRAARAAQAGQTAAAQTARAVAGKAAAAAAAAAGALGCGWAPTAPAAGALRRGRQGTPLAGDTAWAEADPPSADRGLSGPQQTHLGHQETRSAPHSLSQDQTCRNPSRLSKDI